MPEATEPAERTAWFSCFAGIAGDMALGALLDAGADLDEVTGLLHRLPVGGWAVRAEDMMRNGIGATHLVVETTDDTTSRTYADITALLAASALPDRVLARAQATFAALARVEAHIHRQPVDSVHFHEVGGLDAIVDVVGVAAALEVLGVDRVASSPVALGHGTVRSAHGVLPNPAPAVVALLAGAPVHGLDVSVELTTPTGAALLASLVTTWGPLPDMTIDATGYGAGTRELETLPNVTQVVVGRASATTPLPGQPLVLLEANLDDATGETLAHAIASLLDAGAADAWLTPILMKKGRPAHLVSVLADSARAAALTTVLGQETGTLGVRGTTVSRWPSPRKMGSVVVDGHKIRVKVAPHRVKAEHDDAADIARRTGRPVAEVAARAEAAWRDRPT